MDSEVVGYVVLGASGLVAIFLITQRWFWSLALGLGALAAAFACLASIVHFQILGAIGFFVLACVLWIIYSAVAEES